LTARCFQHEMDHMQGSNFITRANVYHREQAFKRLAKAVRNKQVAEMMMRKNKQNFVVQPKRSFQNDEFVYTT
jgi:hypothetical protein